MRKLLCILYGFCLTSIALASFQPLLPTDNTKNALQKLNANFSELYSAIGVADVGGDLSGTIDDLLIVDGAVGTNKLSPWVRGVLSKAYVFGTNYFVQADSDGNVTRQFSLRGGQNTRTFYAGITQFAWTYGDNVTNFPVGQLSNGDRLTFMEDNGSWIVITKTGGQWDTPYTVKSPPPVFCFLQLASGPITVTNHPDLNSTSGTMVSFGFDDYRVLAYNTEVHRQRINALTGEVVNLNLGKLAVTQLPPYRAVADAFKYDGNLVLTSRVVTIPPGTWGFSYWNSGSNRVSNFPTNGRASASFGQADELYVLNATSGVYKIYTLGTGNIWRVRATQAPATNFATDLIGAGDLAYYVNNSTNQLVLDWSSALGYTPEGDEYLVQYVPWAWSAADYTWLAWVKIEVQRIMMQRDAGLLSADTVARDLLVVMGLLLTNTQILASNAQSVATTAAGNAYKWDQTSTGLVSIGIGGDGTNALYIGPSSATGYGPAGTFPSRRIRFHSKAAGIDQYGYMWAVSQNTGAGQPVPAWGVSDYEAPSAESTNFFYGTWNFSPSSYTLYPEFTSYKTNALKLYAGSVTQDQVTARNEVWFNGTYMWFGLGGTNSMRFTGTLNAY